MAAISGIALVTYGCGLPRALLGMEQRKMTFAMFDTPQGVKFVSLDAHDWHTVTCQCEHHKPRACTNEATHIIAIHAIERCKTPGLTPNGDRIEIRCRQCCIKLWLHIADLLNTLNGAARCGSCDTPLIHVSDVLRSIEPFK